MTSTWLSTTRFRDLKEHWTGDTSLFDALEAHYGIRTRRHKLIRYVGPESDDEWELFDLAEDPHVAIREMRAEVELPDELPAPRAVLTTDAGVAASLRLRLAVRRGVHVGAALDDVLVDPVALGAHQPRRRVPDVVAGVGGVRAVLAHRPRDRDEQVALLAQRHASAWYQQ